MPLQGSFQDVSLSDLIQIITRQGKTGLLSLEQTHAHGQVFLYSSQLFAAFVYDNNQLSLAKGHAAIDALLEWPDGKFIFEIKEASNWEVNRNIEQSWEYLYLEYCRRKDESQTITLSGEVANLRPSLLADPIFQAQINLELEEWQLLLKVDGQTSLAQIAYSIGRDLKDVYALAQKLANLGLLKLSRGERPFTQMPLQTGVNSSLPQPASSPSPFGRPPTPIVSATTQATLPQLSAPDATRHWSIPIGSKGANERPEPDAVSAENATFPPSRLSQRPLVGKGVLASIISKIRGL